MGIFNRKDEGKDTKAPAVKPEAEVKVEKKAEAPKPAAENKVAPKKAAPKKGEVYGKSIASVSALVKPLITEKAAMLNAENKYVFAVDPSANKLQIKQAIRTVYNVEPVSVNIVRFSGKRVRYGRLQGKRKAWKKAIVTLKPEDKIQVYEGI